MHLQHTCMHKSSLGLLGLHINQHCLTYTKIIFCMINNRTHVYAHAFYTELRSGFSAAKFEYNTRGNSILYTSLKGAGRRITANA